jgi:TetR/AcrR family transcriptional regulator, lmrAB and yxaGH operons repressor
LVEAGMDRAIAQQRGEDAAITVQGALILAQALDDPLPFLRVMQQLPTQLCSE